MRQITFVMGKRLLSVVAGLAVAFLLIMVMEKISSSVYPISPNVKVETLDRTDFAEIIKNMPIGAFLFILAGYALGSFGGGLTAALIATENRVRSSLIVGAVVMLGGVMNVILIPHPMWFTICTFLAYLPFAWLGGFIVNKTKSK